MTSTAPARIVALPVRGLRREAAAGYVGISPSKFDQLVQDKRMPAPFRIDSLVLWDVRDLDPAIDELKHGANTASDWDDYNGAAALR